VLCSTFKAERDAAKGGLEKVPKTQKRKCPKRKRKSAQRKSLKKQKLERRNHRTKRGDRSFFHKKIEATRGLI